MVTDRSCREQSNIVVMFTSISNFVQQLLAAELFFAVGFLMLLAFVGACYLLGAVSQRAWTLMKQEVQKHSAHLHGALPAQPLYRGSR